MTITLTPRQRAWIDDHVALGQFASTADAARILLDEAMHIHDGEFDDLRWAKPMVEEALAEVERGETISAEQSRAEIAAFLDTLEK